MKTQFRLLIIVLLSFCQEKGPAQNPIDTLYQGCCGTAAVQITMNNSLIYVPNIFTPNGDAINDLFRPYYDASKVALETFVIKDKNAESNLWVMNIENLRQAYWGWFGLLESDAPPYRGKFTYSIGFRNLSNNSTQVINGSACSVYCMDTEHSINIERINDCFFPCQYGDGEVDPRSPINIEIDCIKQ